MTLTSTQFPDDALWNRISTYSLPDDSAGLSFLEQLRAQQGISRKTALRGIEEYRRFVFLSATGDGRSVPSRAVDAVWHLHLTHTRDYWQRFVPDVLQGRELHHTPGKVPGHKTDFADTVRRYEMTFGEAPPKGIWKQRTLIGTVAGLIFALAFVSAWLGLAIVGGAPTIFVMAGVLLGALVVYMGAVQVLDYFGIEIGVGVDIWSDGEGGDCGDGGGGCGD